jgi:hypothetical protein
MSRTWQRPHSHPGYRAWSFLPTVSPDAHSPGAERHRQRPACKCRQCAGSNVHRWSKRRPPSAGPSARCILRRSRRAVADRNGKIRHPRGRGFLQRWSGGFRARAQQARDPCRQDQTPYVGADFFTASSGVSASDILTVLARSGTHVGADFSSAGQVASGPSRRVIHAGKTTRTHLDPPRAGHLRSCSTVREYAVARVGT